VRLAGPHPAALTAVQFVATAALIVAVPLFADIALSGVVPGAADNASGVATVLRLAERYGGTLDHFDVWVLLTGAEEGMQLGMRAWLRKHRRELDPAATAVVCVDEVGSGTVRYMRREGFVLTRSHHPALLALCRQIAEEDEDADGRYGARSLVSRTGSDASAARSRGLPSVRIACRDHLDLAPHHHRPEDSVDRLQPESLERAFGFCSELVELIDERIGPDLETGGSPQVARTSG
jgi:Zn-dependent M28 family amino/carboxypeptidase